MYLRKISKCSIMQKNQPLFIIRGFRDTCVDTRIEYNPQEQILEDSHIEGVVRGQ